MSTNTVKCQHCDGINEKGSIYCRECDKKIDGSDKVVTSTVESKTKSFRISGKSKWGWLLIDYFIFSIYNKMSIKGDIFISFLALTSMFLAPMFYYRMKKNNDGIGNSILWGAITIFSFVFLIGALGILGDKYILGLGNDNTQLVDNFKSKVADAEIWAADFQKRNDAVTAQLINDPSESSEYLKNIDIYKQLQVLAKERYSHLRSLENYEFDSFSKYAFTQNGEQVKSSINEAIDNTEKAQDDLLNAQITYYQALYDNDTSSVIESYAAIVNKKDKELSEIQVKSAAVLAGFQKTLEDWLAK